MPKTLVASILTLVIISITLQSSAYARNVSAPTHIDTGWRLLLDPTATWQNDQLYLPDDVDLAKLPVNPPTAGWSSLSPKAGIPVSLPATVEQFYWGRTRGAEILKDDVSSTVDVDGSYKGVSWWYRTFVPPPLARGQRLIFKFPGARLRAEVYVNGTLVGYNIIDEAPFEADATSAIKPDASNVIAVRITNPGGNVDWNDDSSFRWGSYVLPISHSFGGMDGGVTMSVQAPIAVTDLAVYNRPDIRTVELDAEVSSVDKAYSGPIDFAIEDGGRTVTTTSSHVDVGPGGRATVSVTLTDPLAQEWDILKPRLYTAVAELPSIDCSGASKPFGFRWFTTTGVGKDARLELNNRRVVLRSAITWGYYAPDGIFPDSSAVRRDVAAVLATGLNCIQIHRHMPKRSVVDAFDRTGLLLYCEAGAGQMSFQQSMQSEADDSKPIDPTGATASANTFCNDYETAKVLDMIKAFRSDPSVIAWDLQNEADTDLHNPKIFNVLRKMRDADPSRIVLLKSGVYYTNEAWYPPYSQDVQYDRGDGYSGWHDTHTAGNSQGVYTDSMYNSPTDFEYNSDDVKEISMWGEMATGASLPDLAADIRWYAQHGNDGFDLLADKALDQAYGTFLDTNGFRQAFPTNELLYRDIGVKHYFYASKIIENARIANANDYIVLNGWDAGNIDENSGLWDLIRLPESDISPLSEADARALLVVRPRKYVVATGTAATIDVHLINEIGLRGRATLDIAASQNSSAIFHSSFPVSIVGGDVFGQLLKDGIQISPARSGYVTITAALSVPGRPALVRTERFLAIDESPTPVTVNAALLSPDQQLHDALLKKFSIDAPLLTAGSGPVDTIFATTDCGPAWQSYSSSDPIAGPTDPGLFQAQKYGGARLIASYDGLPSGPAIVKLYCAEQFFDQPGQRLFDIAVNGTTALSNIDIFALAGGKDKQIVETINCTVTDGSLSVSVPKVEANFASLAAIQVITAGGENIRQVFRDSPYTDSAGNNWSPAPDRLQPSPARVAEALKRVHDDGARLIALPDSDDCSDLDGFIRNLANDGVLAYKGMLEPPQPGWSTPGAEGPSWEGFWYFAKTTWLLNGCPQNCVLDWQYQEQHGNAMALTAPGLEMPIAEGHSFSASLGAGAAIVPYGKGQIVLLCLPGLARAFATGDTSGFDPVTATRMIYNCLHG